MSDTARKSFIATLVAVLVIAGALALWHLKVLVALLLLALVISSAMRPGVEWLHRHRIPRALGRRDPLRRPSWRNRASCSG